MNSSVTRQQSRVESNTKRFEFGYEKKSKISRSVQAARTDFLSIILNERLNVVFDLFASAYQPFSDLLENISSEIEAVSEKVESEIPQEAYVLRQPKFIRESALKTLIPDWHSLQQSEATDLLREALRGWATRNNLTDDWCLNLALSFLRAWDEADERKMAIALLPDPCCLIDVVKTCWQCALLDRHSDGLWSQFQSNAEVEERGVFSFNFKYEKMEFSMSGPFSKSVAEFKREVGHKFEAHGGRTVRGARKALQSQLDSYLSQLEPVRTELGLKAPHTRWAMADHLNWLAQYQIPPCKTFREVAREVGKNGKTVREGIRGAARLIGVALRSAESDKQLGRPKGAKDKNPRFRVDRRRRKLRGN